LTGALTTCPLADISNVVLWTIQERADLSKLAIVAPSVKMDLDLPPDMSQYTIKVPDELKSQYLVVGISTPDGATLRVTSYCHCSAQVNGRGRILVKVKIFRQPYNTHATCCKMLSLFPRCCLLYLLKLLSKNWPFAAYKTHTRVFSS
jgi:hypothetical protein